MSKKSLAVFARITASYNAFKKQHSPSVSKSAVKKQENKQQPIRIWDSHYQGTAYRDGSGRYINQSNYLKRLEAK